MLYRRNFYPPMWREMARLERQMNHLFDGRFHSLADASCFPAVNVWTNEDGAYLTAELPGVELKDMDISVVGEVLTLKGEHAPEPLEEGAEVHRQERGCGSFNRSIQLPFPIDVNKVEARLDKGVLYVTLPRAEADKPRKITVKAL
jgi:HSP20 family protein